MSQTSALKIIAYSIFKATDYVQMNSTAVLWSGQVNYVALSLSGSFCSCRRNFPEIQIEASAFHRFACTFQSALV